MLYNAKELKLNVQNMQLDYITFGNGTKPLVMIGVEGSCVVVMTG